MRAKLLPAALTGLLLAAAPVLAQDGAGDEPLFGSGGVPPSVGSAPAPDSAPAADDGGADLFAADSPARDSGGEGANPDSAGGEASGTEASGDTAGTGDDADLAALDAKATGSLSYTLIDLIRFGGWVGYVIIFLSVVAVSLIVEYLISIRRGALAPKADADELKSLVAEGSWEAVAEKAAAPRASFLTALVGAGAKERDRGYDAVVKAMEDTAAERTGRLLRKIEHLNLIANIAPMLGLLGTVMGMVNSFNQISVAVGGVDPRKLAAGIFEALMTTVMGLIVAIPALYLFGIFRNRVDALASETTVLAEDIVEPLKREGARS